MFFVSIHAAKDNFDNFLLSVDRGVEFFEVARELSAGRCPVRAEVESPELWLDAAHWSALTTFYENVCANYRFHIF